MLDEARIPGEAEVLVGMDRRTVVRECAETTLVFVPARVRRDEILDPHGDDIYETLSGLPMAAAVIAGAPVDLTAGPESEHHWELSAAEERVEAAEARLKRLEAELVKVVGDVGELRVRAERNGGPDVDAQLEAAEARHTEVARRTLKAQVILDTARKELEDLLSGAN